MSRGVAEQRRMCRRAEEGVYRSRGVAEQRSRGGIAEQRRVRRGAEEKVYRGRGGCAAEQTRLHLWTTVTSVLPCSDRSAARDQIELRKLFGLIGKDFECHTGDILLEKFVVVMYDN